MTSAERLRDLAISESGFVFDPNSGYTFNTNPTGRLILDGLKEGLSKEDLVKKLNGAFELDGEDDLERDVDEFIYILRENGILPHDFQL